MNLKTRLIACMKEDWKFPAHIDADTLAEEMKDALASPDGILRDRLVLDGFGILVMSKKVKSEKIRTIFEELVSDKFLLGGLGKEQDDSVFGRAFSGYGILSLLEYGKGSMLFTKDDILRAYNAVLKCFREEKDLRGYVDGKGWAHSIAHNADCLAAFAADNNLGHDELIALLFAVKERVCQGHSKVISEYERLLKSVMSVLERGLITEQELAQWVNDICEYTITGNKEEDARNIMCRCEFMIL